MLTVDDVRVVIPVYQPVLNAFERFSLDTSLTHLGRRITTFIGPDNLDTSFYRRHFPGIGYEPWPAACFASIADYNRLLLSREFYAANAAYEFVLILQTDAVVLRDDLDYWCQSIFDYIGAPWPDGVEVFVNAGRFEGVNGKRVRACVGNGGFSLRRVRRCVALLDEFQDVVNLFERTGSSEDLFFAIMGNLSRRFILPNEMVASRFSLELKPSHYLAVNGGQIPMGGHAWWKYEPEFWRKLLPAWPANDVAA